MGAQNGTETLATAESGNHLRSNLLQPDDANSSKPETEGNQTADSEETKMEGGDSESRRTMTMDEAIDAVGYGKFQRQILVAAGLCFAADSMEVTLLAFLSSYLGSEWDLTPTQSASITSSVFAGMMLGTLILGGLADHFGRRPLYLTAAWIISIFGVLTAFANDYKSLIFMRFMVGFGVGGLSIPFDILAEFLPVKERGSDLLLIEYFWTFGSLVVPIIAYGTIGTGAGSWNLFVLLCAIPCVFGLIAGICYVPESPRFLVSKGRVSEAMDILRAAASVNGKDSDEVFPSSIEIREEAKKESGFMELFKPQLRKTTFLLWGLWFGMSFGYYGAILVVTRVFTTDSSFNFGPILISASSEIVGLTLVMFTVERFGRIRSQIICYLLGAAFLLALTSPKLSSSVGLLTFCAFMARASEMGASCMTWVSTPEILDTEIRATGHSAANAFARIAGFIAPYIVGGDIPLVWVGIIMAIVHVATAICASFLPETSGKSMGSESSSSVSVAPDSSVDVFERAKEDTNESLPLRPPENRIV